jgi:hypothetical protein
MAVDGISASNIKQITAGHGARTFKSVTEPTFSDRDYHITVSYDGGSIFLSNTGTYLPDMLS